MVSWTMAASVIVAVKNGPPGMWRALGQPQPAEPIGWFATSPLWMAVTTCSYLALAVVVSRRAGRGTAPPGSALVVSTAVLGLLVMVELLVRGALLGLLVLVFIVAAWIVVLFRANWWQARRQARR